MITDCVQMYDHIRKENGQWIYEDDEGNYTLLEEKLLLCGVQYKELSKEELQAHKFDMKIPHKMELNKVKRTIPSSKYERTKKESDKFIIENKEVERYQVWFVMNSLRMTTAFNNKDEAIEKAKEINNKILDK